MQNNPWKIVGVLVGGALFGLLVCVYLIYCFMIAPPRVIYDLIPPSPTVPRFEPAYIMAIYMGPFFMPFTYSLGAGHATPDTLRMVGSIAIAGLSLQYMLFVLAAYKRFRYFGLALYLFFTGSLLFYFIAIPEFFIGLFYTLYRGIGTGWYGFFVLWLPFIIFLALNYLYLRRLFQPRLSAT